MKYLTLLLCIFTVLPATGGAQTRRAKGKAGARSSSATPAAPVHAAEADAFRLPVGYTGHNPGAVFGAILKLRPSLRKSQFETTPDYETRVEQAVANLPGVSSRLTFVLPDVKVKYDADAGAFRLDTQPESVFFPTTYASGDYSRQYSDFTSYFLVWNKKTLGSGVGRNAFGLKKRYVITAYTSLRLAVPVDSVTKLRRGVLVPATPQSARVMYAGIKMALTGDLIPPYGGEEQTTDTATISNPEEAHYFKYYVYFRPDTAVVYDVLTGEVYGSVELVEENRRPLTLSYSEPPVIAEDPLSRQQRLQEEQREYPAEHVFKQSEVDDPARITFKPEPGFTEEARAANISGTVRLLAILKSDGTVEVRQVQKELPMGLTQKAINAAKQIRFLPARRNGRAVSMYLLLEYNFNVY